jgi:hypothetical protein
VLPRKTRPTLATTAIQHVAALKDRADAVRAAALLGEEEALRDVATRILHAVDIERDAIALMSRSQNVTKDPRLALAYFHLCSTDPDKCLNGPVSSATYERILRAIGGPVGQAESARYQMSAARTGPWIWPLGCVRLVQRGPTRARRLIIDAGLVGHLHAAFALTDDQALRRLPGALVARHACALHAGGQ